MKKWKKALVFAVVAGGAGAILFGQEMLNMAKAYRSALLREAKELGGEKDHVERENQHTARSNSDSDSCSD